MDESLRGLLRAWEANPADFTAATRAISAAQRASYPDGTQGIVSTFLPHAYSALQTNVEDQTQRDFIKQHDPLTWCGWLCADTLDQDGITTFLVVEPGREFHVQFGTNKEQIPSLTLTRDGLYFLKKIDEHTKKTKTYIDLLTENGFETVEADVHNEVNRIIPWDNFRTYGKNYGYLPERFNRVIVNGLENDFRRSDATTELCCIHTSEEYAFAAIGACVRRLTQQSPGEWRGKTAMDAGDYSRMIRGNVVYEGNSGEHRYLAAELIEGLLREDEVSGENIPVIEGLPVIPNRVSAYAELAFGFNRDNSMKFIQIPITVIDQLHTLSQSQGLGCSLEDRQAYFDSPPQA